MRDGCSTTVELTTLRTPLITKEQPGNKASLIFLPFISSLTSLIKNVKNNLVLKGWKHFHCKVQAALQSGAKSQ